MPADISCNPTHTSYAHPLAGPFHRAGHCIEVARDLACLPLSIVNVMFAGPAGAGDRGWALIDAGLAFSANRIRRAAAERYGARSRPAAIVLTHGHFDHVGALPELADAWGVALYAHELELPYLTGRSAYPPPDPAVGGGAMSFLSRFYPRGPYDLGARVRPLPADGTVPGMPGWRWVHTPGHTPGHVALFRDDDRTVVAGDAFVTTRQESAFAALLPAEPHVHRPPAYFTPDWQAARHSVEAIARLAPEVAVTGHGLPMAGARLRRELHALVQDWYRVAVPPHGRYVRRSAVADERGVVSVPPAVVDPQLVALAGAGFAAAAAWWCLRGTSGARAQ